MPSFDYVIVGAGSAASVLARRLTSDSETTICMLEAGVSDRRFYVHVPAGFVKNVYGTAVNWGFKSEPVPGLGGRVVPLAQGKVVGGSSSINGMVYLRGKAADFDGWEARGNPGWGYLDLLPYFKRLETKIGAGDDHYRGRDGELPITESDWRHPICDAFIAAGEAQGIRGGGDPNGELCSGTGYYQRFIRNGWRVSAAQAFLRPALKTGRIDLRLRCQVERIVFEGSRAVGVAYRDASGVEHVVKARREVLVCAGAINSPKLLQLSGIGPPALLQQMGIEVRHALPGVGENLRDHYGIRLVARAKRHVTTINELSRGPRLGLEIMRWAAKRPSILAVSVTQAYVIGGSRDNDNPMDCRFIITPGSYAEGKTYVLDEYPGFTLGFSQSRPQSSGYVRITSRDAAVQPAIQPNYLHDDIDQATVLQGVRRARELMHSDQLAPYLEREALPGPAVQTDAEWLDFARRNGNTGFHFCGTCRIGPESDPTSVVDGQLRVRGVQGLRVVDASVMPMITSANTFAATLAIAERASDLIRGKMPMRAEPR